jgi:hypothetical protein
VSWSKCRSRRREQALVEEQTEAGPRTTFLGGSALEGRVAPTAAHPDPIPGCHIRLIRQRRSRRDVSYAEGSGEDYLWRGIARRPAPRRVLGYDRGGSKSTASRSEDPQKRHRTFLRACGWLR